MSADPKDPQEPDEAAASDEPAIDPWAEAEAEAAGGAGESEENEEAAADPWAEAEAAAGDGGAEAEPAEAEDPWAAAEAAAGAGDAGEAGSGAGEGGPAGADGMTPSEWAAALRAHVAKEQGDEPAPASDDPWADAESAAGAPAADAGGETDPWAEAEASTGGDSGAAAEDPWTAAEAEAGVVASIEDAAGGLAGDDDLPPSDADDDELPVQPGEVVDAAELVPFGEDEKLDAHVRAVGALLFASPDPLSEGRLRDLIEDVNKADLRAAVGQLQARFLASGLPFVCRSVAGGWRLFSEPALADVVQRLAKARKIERISQAALETLAIIAYRQPVTKAEIEAIRGVQAGPMLRTLVDRHLVRVAGRADQPGAPLLYATTSDFLDRFGLAGLKDLPRDAELARD